MNCWCEWMTFRNGAYQMQVLSYVYDNVKCCNFIFATSGKENNNCPNMPPKARAALIWYWTHCRLNIMSNIITIIIIIKMLHIITRVRPIFVGAFLGCAYYPTGSTCGAHWSFEKMKHYLSYSPEVIQTPVSCLHLIFNWKGEEESEREKDCGWRKCGRGFR